MRIFYLVFLLFNTSLFSEADDSLLYLQEWQGSSSVLTRKYSWEDAVKFIKQDSNAAKSWATDTTPHTHCSLVYKSTWGRIWTMGFLYNVNVLFVRDHVVPLFQENDFVLIPFWGELEGWSENLHCLLKNAKYAKNFFFMTNDEKSALDLRNRGLQAYCVSHNAFIDPNVFHPVNSKKEFSAVYLGDCREQKRLHLAKNVIPNLEVITFNNEEQRKVVAAAKSIIQSPPISKYAEYICKAHCGLMLSAAEGGCYASTEYLYCGLPVVSTKSIGGRDSYYDEVTSIVVDDSPEEVARGVEELKNRMTDPWEVRRRALLVSDKMLNTLAYDILKPIFLRYNDPYADNPRLFISDMIKKSKKLSSKGRTVFQPEDSNHKTVEKIQKTQRKKIKGDM